PTGAPLNVRTTTIEFGEAPPQDSWNGEVLGYVVRWHEVSAQVSVDGARNEGGGGREVVRGWSGAEVTLGALREHTRYAVTVRAFNRAGPGPPSHTVYCSTEELSADLALQEPTGLSCEPESARSLRVRWTASAPGTSPGNLIVYEILYTPILDTG
ncbi:unnamed protein product, partial [Leptidea sinapis]